jgi:hypothetical protein
MKLSNQNIYIICGGAKTFVGGAICLWGVCKSLRTTPHPPPPPPPPPLPAEKNYFNALRILKYNIKLIYSR